MNAKTQPIVNPETQRILKKTDIKSLKKFYKIVAKSSNGGFFIEPKKKFDIMANDYPKHRIFYIDPKKPKTMRPIRLNINKKNIYADSNMIKKRPNNTSFFNNAEWPPINNSNASREYRGFSNYIASLARQWRVRAARAGNKKRVNTLKKTILPNNVVNTIGEKLKNITTRRIFLPPQNEPGFIYYHPAPGFARQIMS